METVTAAVRGSANVLTTIVNGTHRWSFIFRFLFCLQLSYYAVSINSTSTLGDAQQNERRQSFIYCILTVMVLVEFTPQLLNVKIWINCEDLKYISTQRQTPSSNSYMALAPANEPSWNGSDKGYQDGCFSIIQLALRIRLILDAKNHKQSPVRWVVAIYSLRQERMGENRKTRLQKQNSIMPLTRPCTFNNQFDYSPPNMPIFFKNPNLRVRFSFGVT